MFEPNQKNLLNGTNGRDRTTLTLLILILGILSVASIGILVLAMLRQMYPKVFAAPGVNRELNYQGKLQDADGITVPDGSYSMEFTIYNHPTLSNPENLLWSARETDGCGGTISPDVKSITTYNGVFSTLLGESGDCPIDLDFNDDSYYLGVTIGADPEMTPRKRIGAAGYAFNADLLDGLNTSDAGGLNALVPVTNASGDFVLSADVTFDGNTFFLDSANNRIGVNNATPSYTLDVTSSEVGGRAVFGQATETSATVNYGGYFTAAGGGTAYNSASAAVYGEATNTGSVANLGGYFVSKGAHKYAAGVIGYASDPGAFENTGGVFISQGQSGRGVYGLAYNAGNYQTTGVKGEANSYGAHTTGVLGTVSGDGDDLYGVQGIADESGAYRNYGGYFLAKGTGAYTSGVYGEARGSVNDVYGVQGLASDTGAYTNYGGYFKAKGTTGRGVYGIADSATATANYGGYFTAAGSGTNTSGVYGSASSTTNLVYGGYFVSNSDVGVGVYGQAPNTTDDVNYGGWFTAQGGGGVGVYGSATDSAGTQPNYGGYFAAAGNSGSAGVYAEAYGTGGTGVAGLASDPGATANYGGVFAASGNATGATGVTGQATGTGAIKNYGGNFVAAGSGLGAAGVYGEATDITGTVYGGHFVTSSPNGYGVYGQSQAGGVGIYGAETNPSAGGIGVQGFANNPSGWSGYFSGGQGAYINKVKVGPATTAPSENLDVVGNIANLADTAVNPTSLSSTATGTAPIHGFISGRYFYVVNHSSGTLQIFDVTDPTSPFSVSSVAAGADARYVYVSGRYAYIINDSLTSTFRIFDISNPTVPVQLSSIGTSGTDPIAVYVSGHYAYVVNSSLGSSSLEIFDVSNPISPVSISVTATSTYPFNVFVSGRYAYIVDFNGTNLLEIYDVSDPTAPSLVGSTATESDPRAVYVSGRYAYVVNYIAGTLQIFDVKNPSTPTSVGKVAVGLPYFVYVSGRYAYVADIGGSKLKVIDVSDPTTPVVVGSASTGSSPTSVYVSGRYAYTANAGANTFQIFDVSGLETTSAMIHSLEAGNLQVRNDIIAHGELNVNGGLNVGGVGFFNDSLSVHSIGASGGYFQADGSGATAVAGLTTNSSGAAFAGLAMGADSIGISIAADPLAVGATMSRGGSFAVGTGSASIGGSSHMIGVEGIAGGGTATNYGGVFTAGSLVSRTIGGANNVGVAGFAEGSTGTNYGGYFKTDGTAGAGYGVYSTVVAATDWAGYFTGSGLGLYTNRLAVNDTSAVAYNTIGTAAASHTAAGEIENASDLFIADDLEVNGWAWLDGGYTDIAEMIEYTGNGEAGDVIVIDQNYDNTARLADKPYDKNIIGVISEKPSLIITGGIKEGKLLAVAGRIPTKVTNINGPIKRGDLLTTSSKPGHAMKATEPGPTVGKALEPCNQDSCTIWVFLNVGWYGGASTSAVATSSSQSVVYQTVDLEKLTADLDVNGFAINNVLKIVSKDEVWSIDEKGVLKVKIDLFEDDTYNPEHDPAKPKEKEIFGLGSAQVEIILSGSAQLEKGEMLVDFGLIDPEFVEIINLEVPLKISVTPTEICRGLYVAEKYPQGFKVKELNGGTSNAAFDWIVIGRRKGY